MGSSKIGQIAISLGFLTAKQLDDCLAAQEEYLGQGEEVRLLEIMRLKQIVTDAQINVLLATQTRVRKREALRTPAEGSQVSKEESSRPSRRKVSTKEMFFGKVARQGEMEESRLNKYNKLRQRYEKNASAALALAIGRLCLDIKLYQQDARSWFKIAIKLDPVMWDLLDVYEGAQWLREMDL